MKRGYRNRLFNIERRKQWYSEIERMYHAEISVLAMSKTLGINRRVVSSCLGDLGLKPRTGSEANRIRLGRMTELERRQLASAANNKARNSGRQREAVIEMAKRRQESPQSIHIGKFEPEIILHLENNGIKVIPQFAFDIYNLDIFIPDRKTAVEVYTTTCRPVQRSHAAKKAMQILSSGICLT